MTSPAKVAPKPLYYAVVDGTDFVDSAAFGAELEAGTAFRNIASDFLAPSSLDPARLVDPTNPEFPVWRVKASGRTAVTDPKGIAVVAPAGLNGQAKGTNEGSAYAGDDAKVNAAGALINRWIFEPVVSVKSGKAVLDASGTSPVRAQVIAVSSHGWLGGYCVGEIWHQPHWFLIGKSAYDGVGFKGPIWVVLAQCSTLNSAAWPSWAKVLMNSNPHVRGILGYEEVAPGAVTATAIGRNFVKQLKAGKTFLEAWKANNQGNNWAALIHKEAIKDKLSDMAAIVEGKKPLSDVTTSDTVANYKGFLKSDRKNPNGVDVFIKEPPFTFSLALGVGAKRGTPVEPWNLDGNHSKLHTSVKGGTQVLYEVKLGVRGGARITKASIEWIHIRPSKVRLNMKKILDPATADRPAKFTTSGLATTIATLDAPSPEVAIQFPVKAWEDMTTIMGSQSHHGDDKLVPHHSYLWLRIGVTTDAGKTLTDDFPTKGLSWFGPPGDDPRYH